MYLGCTLLWHCSNTWADSAYRSREASATWMPPTRSISQASSCTCYSQTKALDSLVQTWLANNARPPCGHQLNPCSQLFSITLLTHPQLVRQWASDHQKFALQHQWAQAIMLLMTTDISSLCTVQDTGILLGNNSALCHSTAQDWRQCYFACNCASLCAGEKLLNPISHNSWSTLPLNISVLAYFLLN